jgi:hypothetical protein
MTTSTKPFILTERKIQDIIMQPTWTAVFKHVFGDSIVMDYDVPLDIDRYKGIDGYMYLPHIGRLMSIQIKSLSHDKLHWGTVTVEYMNNVNEQGDFFMAQCMLYACAYCNEQSQRLVNYCCAKIKKWHIDGRLDSLDDADLADMIARLSQTAATDHDVSLGFSKYIILNWPATLLATEIGQIKWDGPEPNKYGNATFLHKPMDKIPEACIIARG